MPGINSIVLVGRVGQDPDYRRFQDGGEIIEFSLATSETWRDRSTGEKREKTQWHRIKVSGENAVKVVRDYVRKGDQIGIEGRLEYREWEKDGQKHKGAEIVVGPFSGRVHLMGSKDDRDRDSGGDRGSRSQSSGGGSSRSSGGGYGDQRGGGTKRQSSFADDMDNDDIPF